MVWTLFILGALVVVDCGRDLDRRPIGRVFGLALGLTAMIGAALLRMWGF